ncbi:hypothetical protein FACS1894202_08480 [Clostridia bacterium]|nr:hypothetical protein FACS1894202_08480 [Clostridia bacterium]
MLEGITKGLIQWFYELLWQGGEYIINALTKYRDTSWKILTL